MTWQRKLAVGPARVMSCAACTAPVSTPWWSVVAVVPVWAGILAAQSDWLRPIAWLYVASGFCVMAALHLAFVPLVPRPR